MANRYRTAANDRLALTTAIVRGDASGCEKLIEAGVDVNGLDRFRDTPLHVAADSDRDGTCAAAALIKAGAKLDARNLYGSTPLYVAAKRGNVPMCQLLVQAGADPKIPQQLGSTPLYAALIQGHAHVAQLLVNSDFAA